MIDQIRLSGGETFDPALDFVRKRMNASQPADRKLVAGLLQGEGALARAFSALVEKLSDGRKRYSLTELHERDARAEERAGQHVPEEHASRVTMLRREDEGVPNALELFFLTLLSDKEWVQLCTTKERAGNLGELPARNVIESVLSDEPRTKKFIHAVDAEVRKFGDSASTIYDAGCGPFPILGLAAAIASPKTKVTCIELNPLSAKIAQAIVNKFVANGSIAEGQIVIKETDALTEPLPEEGSVDLFISETLGAGLLDEQGPRIFSRYAPCINQERGSTIPHRAKLSTALMPINHGISHTKDGTEVTKYEFVVNANGTELPVMPSQEWTPLKGGSELPLTDIPEQIEGVVDLPSGLKTAAFDGNYGVVVCAEFVIDQDGREVATQYETFITSPMPLGMGIVVVPNELKKVDVKNLEVRFEFAPGSDSRKTSRIEVVRKDHTR